MKTVAALLSLALMMTVAAAVAPPVASAAPGKPKPCKPGKKAKPSKPKPCKPCKTKAGKPKPCKPKPPVTTTDPVATSDPAGDTTKDDNPTEYQRRVWNYLNPCYMIIQQQGSGAEPCPFPSYIPDFPQSLYDAAMATWLTKNPTPAQSAELATAAYIPWVTIQSL